ncbi:MAG: DUF86 domain-containing protein [Thermaerobacterales bacterium]
MPMIEEAKRKLAKLVQYLEELETKRGLTFETYRANWETRRVVERQLQLVVEVMTDINTTLLVALDQPPPKDYFLSFIEAGEKGIIPRSLADRLAPGTGLRNRLVHEYETVDDRIVHQSIEECLVTVPQYVAAVKAFLDRSAAPGGRTRF